MPPVVSKRYLEERGIGFDVGVTKVPSGLPVPACLIWEWGVRTFVRMGRWPIRPVKMRAASRPQREMWELERGCSVGKYRGMERAMKSGFGTYAVQAGHLKVGALVAVNALGDIYDGAAQIAGLRNAEGTGLSNTLEELFQDVTIAENLFAGNTTLGIVVTNAKLNKDAAYQSGGHDPQRLRPGHPPGPH